MGDEMSEDETSAPSPSLPKKRKVAEPERRWAKRDLVDEEKRRFVWVADTEASHQDLSPLTLFELYFDDTVCRHLVQETLRYAAQKGNNDFKFSIADLKVFIGILIVSGYNCLPSMRMYWSADSDLRNQAICDVMSRIEFEKILRFFHLANNDALTAGDKFSKVRPLFDFVNERCLKYFPRTQHLAIDESMVPYYGHHGTKQFIKGKPIRFGYKIWCCCTPEGYLVQLEPYQGAQVSINDEHKELGVGGGVVMRLISQLPLAPYTVYTDNFFTSLKLAEALLSKGIALTGTVRSNRVGKCPLESLDKTDRGSMDYRVETNVGVLIVRWNDNNVVTVLSTVDTVFPQKKVLRWSRKTKTHMHINQPRAITSYNSCMGGVDRLDQNVGSYRVTIRKKKWWWPLFRYLLDVSIQNTWLLYRRSYANTQRSMTQLQFRRELVLSLFRKYGNQREVERIPRAARLCRSVPDCVRLDGLHHYQGGLESTRRCALPSCKKNTGKQCLKCGVPLHDKCSIYFHT